MKRIAILCLLFAICTTLTGCCCCPALSEENPLGFLGLTTTHASSDQADAVTSTTENVSVDVTPTEDADVPVETTTTTTAAPIVVPTTTTTRRPGITYKDVQPYRIPIANPDKNIYDAPDGNRIGTFGNIDYYTIVEQATDTNGFTWGRLSDSDTWTLIYKEILPDLALLFESGIGNWYTDLAMHGDGTFTGHYYDLDMGDGSDEYVNGTCYVSDFSGSFRVVDISNYTVTLELTGLKTEQTPNTSWVEDNVRYIAGVAYGLQGGTTFTLYTPDTPVSMLPTEVLEWHGIPSYGNLGRYVLYCPAVTSIFLG